MSGGSSLTSTQKAQIDGAVQKAGGDATSTIVTSVGGTTSRTMGSRAADHLSIEDFTSRYVPGRRDNAAVQAAITAASNASGSPARLLWYNPGTYNLTTTQYSQGNDASIISEGAEFVGSSFPVGMTDGAVLQDDGTALAIGKVMDAGSGSGHGGHTTLFVGAVNSSYTKGTTPYEHDAEYINLYNYDPSQYPSNGTMSSYVAKDAVSLHVAASLAAGSGSLGRIWGIEDDVQINPGQGDGIAHGLEIGINNWSGAASGRIGSYTSKTGVNLWAGGNANSTNAINIGSSATGIGWEDGIYASNLINNFLRLNNGSGDLFLVSATGALTTASSIINGSQRVKGNMTLNGFLIHTTTTDITTVGTTRTTALALIAHYNVVTTCRTGAVTLPSATPAGGDVYVLNRCRATLYVYPDDSSHQIEAHAAGTATMLTSGVTGHFMRESSVQWRQI